MVRDKIIIDGGLKSTNLTSGELLVLKPSCNPGMQGSMAGKGCTDCPFITYSKENGSECTLCSHFFTTNQTGSRYGNSCNVCHGVCNNGGSCIVTNPNSRYECKFSALFTGPTCGNVGPALGLGWGLLGGLILLYLIFRLAKYFKRVKQDAQIIRERDVYALGTSSKEDESTKENSRSIEVWERELLVR